MKTKLFFASAAALVALLPAAWSAVPAKSETPTVAATIEVSFEQPENFTDVKDGYNGSDKGRENVLAGIKKHLEQRGARFLSAGQKLSVKFLDIDMAGDFEPWRGSEFSDVRIIRDIYPPRIKLNFQISDASGRVLNTGDRELLNPSFQMSAAINMSDPLRYEKDMLDSWMRREVKIYAVTVN